jgi:N-acetylmuramoyl-L-alanine amidase
MKNHTVVQGECLSSIAEDNGFFWETLWNHPENKQLREKRKDPNILYPGDVVFIPDKRLKEISESTNNVYKFRLKNTPAKLRVRVLRDAEPRSGEAYVLFIDKAEIKRGKIPPDGNIEIPILPQAREGKLSVGEGEEAEEYILNLGCLDPIDTISGVKARLNSIGFDCGRINNDLDEETIETIADFQAYINHPNPTGELDDRTREALSKLHDEANA